MKKLFNKKTISLLTLVAILMVITTACTTTSSNSPNQSTSPIATQTAKTTETAQTASSDTVQPIATDKTISLAGYGSKGALADNDLTLADMLTYAAQDEYLAHSEYEKIIEKFGTQNPYSNTVKAEQTHLLTLKDLYVTYRMTFPEDTSNEYLVVPNSLLDAAKTGVQAEIDNIAMYKKFLTYELPSNVRDVFESLKAASESHLDAFQRQVDKLS